MTLKNKRNEKIAQYIGKYLCRVWMLIGCANFCFVGGKKEKVKRLIVCICVLVAMVKASMAADITPGEMVEKLRSMVLHLNPKDIGLTKENFSRPVFAVMMETGSEDGFFTLSAIADGSTSLYFSHGGGIIGGGEHESVRKASRYLLSVAQPIYEKAQKVTAFPKPDAGEVIFYFITFHGVRSYMAVEDDLGNKKDVWSHLFFAAHKVIAKLRQVQENAKPR